jgi:hypothetical protein
MKYMGNDVAPFYVYVETKDASPISDFTVGTMRDINISSTDVSISKVAKGRVKVTFKSKESANRVLFGQDVYWLQLLYCSHLKMIGSTKLFLWMAASLFLWLFYQ